MCFSANLASPDDTRRFARTVLENLPPGTLLVLTGPLGAGKTTLVQKLAVELHSNARVTSPTYTLIHEYPTPTGPLVHIDAFRLSKIETLFLFGLDNYLEHSRLVVVEWGKGLLDTYPDAGWVDLSLTGGHRIAYLRK